MSKHHLIMHGMAEDRKVEDITKVQDVAYEHSRREKNDQ